MPARPEHLADYERPPVVETLLSVQFEPIQSFRLVDYGALWDVFRDRFPKVEEKPPLDVAFETFGPRQVPAFKIEFSDQPPLPRIWFLDEHEQELIQFQIDRLTHNWRKTNVAGEYPRYENIVLKFRREVDQFQEFVRARGMAPQLQPTQCEVTYVNHIAAEGSEQPHRDLGRVLGFMAEHFPFEEDLEDARVALRYRLKNSAGEPVGRLHVRGGPALTKEGRPIVQLILTARGRPDPAGMDGVFAFFDLGRDRIVTTFTQITRDLMHKEWRRKK